MHIGKSLAVISILLATWSQSVNAFSNDALRAELARLSGSSAKDCGLVQLKDDPASSWRCAQSADQTNEPFWFAIERQGVDSDIWEAVGRTSSGERYILIYDSNPYGRPELMPRFTRDSCPTGFAFNPSSNGALSYSCLLYTSRCV